MSDLFGLVAKLLDQPDAKIKVGPRRSRVSYRDAAMKTELRFDSTAWRPWIDGGLVDPQTHRLTDSGRSHARGAA